MKITCKNSQKGNAVFLVLIGIGLFALLVFVISKGSRDAGNMELQEKDNLYASEITSYGNAIKNSMDQMIMLKNIDDNNSNGNGFLFSAPLANAIYGSFDSQPSTEVFNSEGGKVKYQKPREVACISKDQCSYEFTGQFEVNDAGDNNKTELAMVVLGLTEGVCKALNKNLGYDWSAIPIGTPLVLERFSGSNYRDGNGVNISGDSNEVLGKLRFCYQEGAGAKRYMYVHVLRAR